MSKTLKLTLRAVDRRADLAYNIWKQHIERRECIHMKRIVTLDTRDLTESAKTGGCGECQTSCQSACKTSCGIANQQCEQEN